MHTTHVVNGDRASWSALAALASFQRSCDQTGDSTAVVALGGETGRHRAKQAGITLTDTEESLRKTLRDADFAIAWDESARTSITKLAPNLPIVQPPSPIPAQAQLFDAHSPHELRNQLDLPPMLPVVALLCDPCGPQQLFTFATLLIAVSLAGYPVVGVTMTGSPDEQVLSSMSKIGRGCSLVMRDVPPWTLLPVCDCAMTLEPLDTSNTTVCDLVQWAAASGTTVLTPTPHQTDGEAQSPTRFFLAKQLLAFLKSAAESRDKIHLTARPDQTACDRWLADFQSQLRDAAAHSGAV